MKYKCEVEKKEQYKILQRTQLKKFCLEISKAGKDTLKKIGKKKLPFHSRFRNNFWLSEINNMHASNPVPNIANSAEDFS